MKLIALFFPSILGTSIFMKLEAKGDSIIRYIYSYVIFVLSTNIVSMFTVVYVLGVDGVVSDALISFSFFIIYTVIACFFSVVGAIVGKIIKNNFSKWD